MASNTMTDEEAAADLAGGKPPADAIQRLAEEMEAVDAAEPEVEERQKVAPERRFKWIDDDRLTVEDWLAGQACAVIQIVPGLTVQLTEATEEQRDEVDALVNGRGPSFLMKGMRDGLMATQVRRASNICLLCQSLTHMNGEPWMPDAPLDQRYKKLKARGTLLVDKLIEAMYEFSDQLLWKIDNGDLGNS